MAMDIFPAQTVASMQSIGSAFNTYTTAKSVLNPTDLWNFHGNFLKLGRKFKIFAAGLLSNMNPTPGTVVFQIMVGTTCVWSSGNLALATGSANANAPFDLEATIRLDSIGTGTSGKFYGDGKAFALNLPTPSPIVGVTGTLSGTGTGIDTTVANYLDFYVGFSTSNASNGFQLTDYDVIIAA